MSVLALQTRKLVKRFGGVTALKDVTFDLRQGEVHALCGENGAGKSTLIKTLSGIHHHGSYGGSFDVFGVPARFRSRADAVGAGIGVIYQELALIPELTVAQNMFLGDEPQRYGLIDHQHMLTQTADALAAFGLKLDPTVPISTLGVGTRQLVEIARALRQKSRILILDEPTAALTEREVQQLLVQVKRLRDEGIGCIYISHKLDEVFAIADRITVLRDGSTVSTRDTKDTNEQQLIMGMVGRSLHDMYPDRKPANANLSKEPLLELNELSVKSEERQLSGISLKVHPGEVVGIGGLMGAGRSELLFHLFGLWGEQVGGEARMFGKTLNKRMTPEQRLASGAALVTEDRKRDGLFSGQSVAFHLSLSSLAAHSRFGLLNQATEADASKQLFHKLQVKADSMDADAGTLSGGNQQKLIIGRVLATDPRLILLDEPTRGIDVGAKAELYRLINKLTDQGVAFLLVSSELPELMGLSDRVIMLHEGRQTAEFSRAKATSEALLSAAMGHPTRTSKDNQANV